MENAYNPLKIESEILEFWKKNKIFEKSVARRKGKKHFVFYEGPPYANGLPGIHHLESRAFKDIIVRYKTMRGFYAPRRAGWDTHGLPTEMEVEKRLGIKSKKEIEEKIGVERFVEEARKNVFLYIKEWEEFTERIGYWLDLENAYVTMTNDYIENLWRIIKRFWEKKLLYEDYKVLPWCPRCQTSLSSHEVAQGYKKIKEPSIYVKVPAAKSLKQPGAYFLVWTTTPWTLPGNVALAVNPEFDYVTADLNGEFLILAESRAREVLGDNFKIANKIKGKDLVGAGYDPLFPAEKEKITSAIYKVIAADFVSAGEGTGIVHIAPAFGEEDMVAAKKNNLAILTTVDEEGKFITPGRPWDKKFVKEGDPLIIENLKNRNLFFKTELYEHDYPFCWRCDSPLLYYAKKAWWVAVTKVKKALLKNNQKINWYPPYLKEGRFGEWLREVKDWAFSRERYWGTPLPVWRCEKCKKEIVVGGLDDLDKYNPESKRIFIARHGEANHNVTKMLRPSWKEDKETDNKSVLTSRGMKEVEKTAAKLKKEKIDVIVSSPSLRTRQTAAIFQRILGAPVIINEKIYDLAVGEFRGKLERDYHKEFLFIERFERAPKGGETLRDIRKRMMAALKEILQEHKGKKILIVSHGDPLWVLGAALAGLQEKDYQKSYYPKTGEVKKIQIHNWPYNKEGELDLHRPYIDNIFLKCLRCAGPAKRTLEVADVWFDSGAMPFAQNYRFWAKPPTANRQPPISIKNIPFPADYICEGLDQTRGWFYTLLAVSTLLGFGPSYKNALSIGTVLDEKGKKMSKSKGNVVLPKEMTQKYGADALRWYFFTINQPWDDKLFNENDVKKVVGGFLNILWNSCKYRSTYKVKSKINPPAGEQNPKLMINKWLFAKFNQLVFETTKSLDDYDIVAAARKIEEFVVEDISRWYIRRIREIMKNSKSQEAKGVSEVFGHVLSGLSKILAPFTPFISDYLFQEISGKKSSVHVEDWPAFAKASAGKPAANKKLLGDMQWVRKIVSLALEARAKAGIKVRQPLASLKILNPKSEIRKNKELSDLIKGEVNVKDIVFDKNIKDEIELDTKITPELKEEGMLREIVRQIQDLRKKNNLKPKDLAELYIFADNQGRNWFIKNAKIIKKETNLKSITLSKTPLVKDFLVFELDNLKLEIGLKT